MVIYTPDAGGLFGSIGLMAVHSRWLSSCA